MLRFKWLIAGSVELDRGFERFSRLVDDWSPTAEPMRDVFIHTEQAQFLTEGAAEGDKWEPLSGSDGHSVERSLGHALLSLTEAGDHALTGGLSGYALWKERHFPGMPILQRTMRLYRGLTDPSSPDFVFEYGERYITLGTRVPYALYHQSRLPRTSHLPRRPEMEFSERTKRAFMKVMQMYAVNIARQFGYDTGTHGNPKDFYKSAAQLSSRYDYLMQSSNN